MKYFLPHRTKKTQKTDACTPTFTQFCHSYVNEGANDYDEIKFVPWVAEVFLNIKTMSVKVHNDGKI